MYMTVLYNIMQKFNQILNLGGKLMLWGTPVIIYSTYNTNVHVRVRIYVMYVHIPGISLMSIRRQVSLKQVKPG